MNKFTSIEYKEMELDVEYYIDQDDSTVGFRGGLYLDSIMHDGKDMWEELFEERSEIIPIVRDTLEDEE